MTSWCIIKIPRCLSSGALTHAVGWHDGAPRTAAQTFSRACVGGEFFQVEFELTQVKRHTVSIFTLLVR